MFKIIGLSPSIGHYLNSTYSKAEIRLQNQFLVDSNTIDDTDLVKDKLIDLKTKEMTR